MRCGSVRSETVLGFESKVSVADCILALIITM
jgi:hypothetical protein